MICYSHEESRNETIYVLHSLDIESEEYRWDPNGNINTEIFEPSERPGLSWIHPDQNRVISYEEGDSNSDSVCTDDESPLKPFPNHSNNKYS